MDPVYPDGWREAPAKRPTWALDRPATPEISRRPGVPRDLYRAIIVEPNPAVGSVLEYLLAREGFLTEVHEEVRPAVESVQAGLADGRSGQESFLLFVAAGDGLYIARSRDAVAALEETSRATRTPFAGQSGATDIRAFVPKPFGARDVLWAVRTVSGSDERGGDRTGAT